MDSKMALRFITQLKQNNKRTNLYSESTTALPTVNIVVDCIHGDHLVASHQTACRACACLRDDVQREVQDRDIQLVY
jgi:hypothetical protein